MTDRHADGGCQHPEEHLERIELRKPDIPYRCDMCTEECVLGIRYKTKLGRIALCDECLTVIQNVAEGRPYE